MSRFGLLLGVLFSSSVSLAANGFMLQIATEQGTEELTHEYTCKTEEHVFNLKNSVSFPVAAISPNMEQADLARAILSQTKLYNGRYEKWTTLKYCKLKGHNCDKFKESQSGQSVYAPEWLRMEVRAVSEDSPLPGIAMSDVVKNYGPSEKLMIAATEGGVPFIFRCDDGRCGEERGMPAGAALELRGMTENGTLSIKTEGGKQLFLVCPNRKAEAIASCLNQVSQQRVTSAGLLKNCVQGRLLSRKKMFEPIKGTTPYQAKPGSKNAEDI